MINPDSIYALRVGPYENWVFEAGDRHAGGVPQRRPLVGCLAEVEAAIADPEAAAAALSAVKATAPGLGRLDAFLTPTLWRPAFASAGPSTAHILPGVARFMGTLAPRLEWMRIGPPPAEETPPPPLPDYGFRLNAPLAEASFDAAFADAAVTLAPDPALAAALAASGAEAAGAPLVVMAVIDDGLAFAHPHLRDKAGQPRVECCWLQGAPAGAGAIAGRVLYGREWRRGEIAALAAGHDGDDAGLYTEAGSLAIGSGRWSPLALSATHGSGVFDIAAGHRHGAAAPAWPAPAPAGDLDRVRLIGVELPATQVLDTAGFGLEAYILAAFHYVFARADAVAAAYGLTRAQVPLIVNLSFGVTGGPHDGQDRLEEAIAQLIHAREALGAKTVLTMPSGNAFLGRLHGELRVGDGASGLAAARWRVQPSDRMSSYLECWYPSRPTGVPPQPTRLRVTPPGAAPLTFNFPALPIAPPGVAMALFNLTIGGKNVGQISLDLFRGYRWRAMAILAPTESRDGAATAPAGVWTIEVDVTPLAADERVDCRIQRSEAMQSPWVGARQSRFDDPRDRCFDATGAPAQSDAGAVFVRRFGTLNGFATHDAVAVVAGRDAATGKPAPYSGAGPVGLPVGQPGAVAVAAACDESPALRGRRAAGVRGVACGRFVGVSVAAPQIARAAAIAALTGAAWPPPAAPPADPLLAARLGG